MPNCQTPNCPNPPEPGQPECIACILDGIRKIWPRKEVKHDA